MIVQRITARYHEGKLEEALALLSSIHAHSKFPHGTRQYVPVTDGASLSIGEYEFADHEEMTRFWENWEAQPESQAFYQKYSTLLADEMSTEIFEMIW